MTKKQASHRPPPLPRDYGDATPRQVAEAMLRYRPGKEPREPMRKPAPVKARA